MWSVCLFQGRKIVGLQLPAELLQSLPQLHIACHLPRHVFLARCLSCRIILRVHSHGCVWVDVALRICGWCDKKAGASAIRFAKAHPMVFHSSLGVIYDFLRTNGPKNSQTKLIEIVLVHTFTTQPVFVHPY